MTWKLEKTVDLIPETSPNRVRIRWLHLINDGQERTISICRRPEGVKLMVFEGREPPKGYYVAPSSECKIIPLEVLPLVISAMQDMMALELPPPTEIGHT